MQLIGFFKIRIYHNPNIRNRQALTSRSHTDGKQVICPCHGLPHGIATSNWWMAARVATS